MATIIATPGAANANSYLTMLEFNAYLATRLSIPELDNVDDTTVLLTMATRGIDAMFSPRRRVVTHKDGVKYLHVSKTWTGAPATLIQRLAWPRTGMRNRNGVEIPSDVIPDELKESTAEFAVMLAVDDTTRDNDVSVQGITSVKAGSVSVNFKDSIERHVLPDAAFDLLVPSWLTDEIIEPVIRAEFTVL